MASAKSPEPVGLTLAKAIGVFTAMGCKLLTEPCGPELSVGHNENRGLYNPDNNKFVDLPIADDDTVLSLDEIAYYERRLELTVPKGSNENQRADFAAAARTETGARRLGGPLF